MSDIDKDIYYIQSRLGNVISFLKLTVIDILLVYFVFSSLIYMCN